MRQNNPDDIAEARLQPSMSPAQISPKMADITAAGHNAIGAAVGDLANAFGQIKARSDQAADQQNDARFALEWSKSQADIWDKTNQESGEDGAAWEGYAPALQKRFEDLNKKFPVSDDKRRLKRELSVAQDIHTRGREATKQRLSMARKYHTGIEAKELQGVIERIGQDPSQANFDDLSERAKELVQSGLGTYYTQADVEKRTREVLGTLTFARYQSLLKADPEAAKALLDKVGAGKFQMAKEAKGSSAGGFKVLDTPPRSDERRKIFSNGGVTVNLDTNWAGKKSGGRTTPMVVIPDDASPEQRKAAQAYADAIGKIYKEKFGVTVKPYVKTRSKNIDKNGKPRGRAYTIHTEPFAVTDTKAVEFFSSEDGLAQHAQIVRDTLGKIPGVQFSLPHSPGKDPGATGSGTSEVELAKKLLPYLKRGGSAEGGDLTDLPSSALRAGQTFEIESPKFGKVSLTAEQINAIPRQLLGQMKKKASAQLRAHRADIKRRITKLEQNAEDGNRLPTDMFDKLKNDVAGSGDADIHSKFQSAVAVADTIRKMRSIPASANRQYITKLRNRFADEAPTPEQEKVLERLETFVSKQESALKSDPMTWSYKSGTVELKPLQFGDEGSMSARLGAALETSKAFGIPPSFFTNSEREAIKDGLANGKISIRSVAASISKNWGKEYAGKALSEISKTAPSDAYVAGHMLRVGDSSFSKDYESARKMKLEKGYKPTGGATAANINPVMKEAVGDAFAAVPGASDVIRNVVNPIYEYRSRREGWDDFKADKYEKIIKEALGETKDDNGQVFGGVIEREWNGPEWFDSKDYKVLVPAGVSRDEFGTLLGMIKVEDLKNPPKVGNRTITDEEFQNAKLLSLGDGRYLLQPDPKQPAVYNGVFDFNEVRKKLMKRRGDLFAN